MQQIGAGATTIAAAAGVTIDNAYGTLVLPAQYAGATLYKRGTNEWVVEALGPGTAGISATITTAKLTIGGTNGSMTFANGILTAQTPAT